MSHHLTFESTQAASAFNQDIDGWDISSATKMNLMFYYDQAFNHELCTWGSHYSPNADYSNMFYGSACKNAATPQSYLGPWCSCMNTESPTSSPTGAPSGVRNTLDHLIVLPDLILP